MLRFLKSCLLGSIVWAALLIIAPSRSDAQYVTAYYPATPVVSLVPTRGGLFGGRIVYRPGVTYAAPVATTAYYAPAPVTTYYAPTVAARPVTTYYAPQPVTTYYAPQPVTTYYAPQTTYYAPQPVTTYYAPATTTAYMPVYWW